jgi:hypothetical protein
LREQLDEVEVQQHRLLYVQAVQVQCIKEVETALKSLLPGLVTAH